MAITTVGRTTIQGATTVGGFNPATLFSAGEQGVWYDPSDLSTLFQDSAGTIPVTALEQPVGRMLDKSGRGNTATQATSANRPVVSARVNILVNSQNFSGTGWTTYQSSIGAATIAPDGTNTAVKIVVNGATLDHSVYQSHGSSTGAFTASFYAKQAGYQWAKIAFDTGTNAAWFDLQNGVIGSITGLISSSSIQNVGNGWFRCVINISNKPSSGNIAFGPANADGSSSWTGDNTSGIYIWGADLRPANQGVNLPPYQRVGAAVAGTSTTVGNADYNANGFPVYLSFDGSTSSRWMATGNINFAINKMSVFAGMRKLDTSGSTQIAVELSASLASNNGAFLVPTIGSGTTDSYRFISKGTASGTATTTPTAYNAPDTRIVTGLGDISAPSASLRLNGSLIQTDTTSQGTGNYGNYPIYVGARGGSLLYWNGYLYGLIVRGASSTANQITSAENWLNQKTAAY